MGTGNQPFLGSPSVSLSAPSLSSLSLSLSFHCPFFPRFLPIVSLPFISVSLSFFVARATDDGKEILTKNSGKNTRLFCNLHSFLHKEILQTRKFQNFSVRGYLQWNPYRFIGKSRFLNTIWGDHSSLPCKIQCQLKLI